MALLNMDGSGSAPVAAAADLIGDTDTANFTADVLNASKQVPVVVDFWAPWCGPCKTLGPILEKLVREYGGRVKLMKINVDENQELAAQMRVQSIPMVVAFKDGRPVDGFQGALPESQVRSFIERLTGGGGSPIDQALAEAKAALDEGDHETAMAIYSEVVQHDGNSAAAHAGLARALIAAGQMDDAREYVDALTDKLRASSDIAAVISALELAAEAGDTGAADELRAKLSQNEDDHETRYQLALALYGANKSEEAIDELIAIIKRKRDWNEDAARKQLLKIFEALGHTNPITVAGRRKLSAVLFSSMRDPFAIPFQDLPNELIVFPLPGALLLPNGRLPLNIFEPRYLNMVEDALAQQRLIGMVQTRDPHEGLVPDGSDLFNVGCAGRIVSFAETSDGRFMLTLEGMCRYRILSEVEGRRGYRRMKVDFSSFKNDLVDSNWTLDRGSFLPVLKRYLDVRGIGVEWKAIEAAPDHLLVASLGMMCPFDLEEKQALIEAPTMSDMADLMRSLMDMATHGGEQSSAKH